MSDFFSRASDLGAGALNWAGKGLISAGRSVSDAGHWAQEQVDDGVQWVDNHADQLVDRFERSPVGDNAVGHFLGSAARNQVHFTGGVAKGVAGLGTGVVGAAGLGIQGNGAALRYASDGGFRQQANETVSRVGGQIADGTVARNVASSVKQAWQRDPADFLGQAVGVVGATVATAGTGTVARGAGAVTDVTGAAGLAGRAGTAGEVIGAGGRTTAAATDAAGVAGRTAAATTEAAGAGGRTAVVRARGTIGEAVFEDTNQMARASEMARADEATLIAERVALREVKKKGALPNGNMATAHAEVGVIQQAFKAGKTMGADMKLVVEGKPVCGHCLGDIPAMAEKAGLKSLTVVEEATGKTLQWKPGMRTLKAAE